MAPPKGKNYVQTQQYQPCWQIPKWMAISSGISWPSCTKTFSFCQIYVNFPGHKRSGLWFWKNCTTSHCQHSIQLYAYTVSIQQNRATSPCPQKENNLGARSFVFFCVSEVLALNIHVKPETVLDCFGDINAGSHLEIHRGERRSRFWWSDRVVTYGIKYQTLEGQIYIGTLLLIIPQVPCICSELL